VLSLHKLHAARLFASLTLAYFLLVLRLFAPAARFERSKRVPSMKRIDFPIWPHLLKYLQVHLKLARAGGAAMKLTVKVA
jgi:hypothetical protein